MTSLIVVAAAELALVWSMWRILRKAFVRKGELRRLAAGLCPKCSYTLGVPGITVCPECGTEIPSQTVAGAG